MNQHNQVDVAEWAAIEHGPQDITLRWEEMRDVFSVVVHCADVSALSGAKLQYWQRVWPGQRVPKGTAVGAGRSGWMADDDWFNGEWKTADTVVSLQDDRATYTFNPINAQEFPDLTDFDATYRRTLKIRLTFDGERPEITSVQAHSDSVWQETEVKLEWGSAFADGEWEGQLSVYNGALLATEAASDNVKLGGNGSWQSDGGPGSIRAKLGLAQNEDVNSSDKTIVTMRTTARSFSFLIDEIEAGERIFIKDFDILVTKAADNVDYARFREDWQTSHEGTLYDRIAELPEQTYDRAWREMPQKTSRGFMPLGCDGGRQKFGVDQNGDVFCPKNWIPRVKGRDTERLLWEGREIRYSFGFPAVDPTERHIADGYLPIIYGRWEADGVVYEQTAFATLLGADILSGERMQGDDPTILLAKVVLTNTGDGPRTVDLKLTSRCEVEETLASRDGFVFATNYEPHRMRYFLDTAGKGELVFGAEGLSYKVELAASESHSICLKIPFITLTDAGEYELVKNADYDAELPKVKKFWEDRSSTGAQITTPNESLNNYYKTHLMHMLVTDDREVGSDRYASRVGTFPYGVFANESCMCISDLDRRGYKDEAEERLELLVHYQGTVGLPGTFSSVDGQYYGAGGYECGGYNQHHGWVLWGLGEHYWYHRDAEWLTRVAPGIVKACDWIIRERESTKKLGADGKRVPDYGFLPAGSLEDVTDYWPWLSTNAATCWGFRNAARALADIGHPEGERLLREGEDYRADLLAGFREAMVTSPVVKLRDGTYVPHFPPRQYQRGRGFGWLRETLEGAIHLIRCEVLEPDSEEASWIIKDYEDNLYISDCYGYRVEDFERDWFSQGGFSMQSNLLCHPIPYLWRDEPKHYLRGYFNAFASVFYPDICACVEHALPTLAGSNSVWFKPSDEAQSTYWLRLMFIYERGDELDLGMALPREWLKNGETVKIERAATYFGEMGYEICSEAENGKITMILEPPTRNAPEAINIRFRHPEGLPMKQVFVNGQAWSDFCSEKELIRLGKVTAKTEIVARY